MKTQKMMALAGVALLAVTPFAAQANNSDKATDACVQAFVDAHVPKGRNVRVRKLGVVKSPLNLRVRQYTVTLSARLARSGTELATARCLVSEDGEVLALDGPLANVVAAPATLVSLK